MISSAIRVGNPPRRYRATPPRRGVRSGWSLGTAYR